MKKKKISLYLNIIIVIFEIISIAWMMSGIKIFSDSNLLMESKLQMLKYFTVDSNIILGIVALIAVIAELKYKNKKPEIVYILKLMGTVGVTLTMAVTICFLAPTMGIEVCYVESNIFLHIINPILSIITFVFFEKNKILKFRHTLTAMIPLLIYSIYYVTISLMHVNNGVVEQGYDWYGFFILGIKSVFIVLPIILMVTYLISLILWKFNKQKK